MREVRGLLWAALVASVALPVFVMVMLGLGLLLESLGDADGWRWCGRIALAAGAVWVVAVVFTAIGGAVAALASPPPRRRPGPPEPPPQPRG